MAAITNLYLQYAYPTNYTNLPVVIWMHGYTGSASVFIASAMSRLALRGLFVAAVGMRGRDGASGSQDNSRREIYDIYDAWAYIQANFASQIDANYLCVCGYSGGGGNALNFACKFPDAANMIVSHFGMSDYGVDPTYGWTGTNTTWIGGTYASVPENYRACNAIEAIAYNYTGGQLRLYHDQSDASVPVSHSTRVGAAMLAAGQSNYIESYTQSGDNPRWLHGNPVVTDVGESSIQTENFWAVAHAAKSVSAWTIPASGEVRVLGYIVTKRFTIWLGNGQSEVAHVTYDTEAGTYSVEPLTGSVDVVITQGVLTASQTISSTTVLQVA